MLSLTSDQLEALSKRRLMKRTFIYAVGKNPDTGLPDPAGFWDDVGDVIIEGKTWHGTGVFRVETLSARQDFSIPGIQVVLNGVNQQVVALMRGSVVGQAPITVYFGLYDVDSQLIIPPLIKRFVGKVDKVEINTPEKGGVSTIVVTCESVSRAMTIKGVRTRSPASMTVRSSADGFYDYTAAQRERKVYFGRKS